MALTDKVGHLLVEKGDEQGGNMRAIDIGIGHDDDFLITQPRLVIRRAHAAAERQHEVSDLLALLHFRLRRIGDIQNFAAQGQYGLIFAVAALFGRTTGAVALNDKQFRTLAGFL